MASLLRTKNFLFIETESGDFDWWKEIDESEQWQQGIFYTLCASYALVSMIALVFSFSRENLLTFSPLNLSLNSYLWCIYTYKILDLWWVAFLSFMKKIWIWIPYPLGKWVDLFWILWNHKGTAMQRNSWMKRLILITTEFWNCIVRENLNYSKLVVRDCNNNLKLFQYHHKSLCRQRCPSNVEIQSDSAFYTCGLGCPSPDFGYLFHSSVCGLWHGPAIMLARWTYSVSPIRLWRKDWVVPGLYV